MAKGGIREKIDISNNELLRMRNESGLNNVDIAEALGVSYSFVIRRIGPCPKDITGYKSLDDYQKEHGLGKYSKDTSKYHNQYTKKKKQNSSTKPKSQKNINLVPKIPSYKPNVQEEKYSICSDLFVNVDYESKMLYFKGNTDDAVFVDFKNIPDVIQFLAWLSRERLESVSTENEG